MFSKHRDKDSDYKEHKQKSSFFGILKKNRDSYSSTSSLNDKSERNTSRPKNGRAQSTCSSSSTDVSDLENHNHSHHHHHQQQNQQRQQQNHDDSQAENQPKKEKEHGHSMLELKRFFKAPNFKISPSHASRNTPSASTLNLAQQDPFNEDGVLYKKYGNMGKILGSGAGGSVRLLTRPSDGVTFAVKEFRARRPNEQMKEYVKKCTSEYSIGSTLHHPNIIKTLDITHFGDHYYEVMEYCPIDFFAVVMSGKMSRGEINCCFRQITEGVKYLHSMGLAHRDLKLDNCVVTKNGILKLIDFGSAVVFSFPYEDEIVKAHGIVGSDPYMAPEVYFPEKYDPRPVDIWSLAIIYCCMTIKRFPWKIPKQTDKSFKLYCLPDDRPHDYVQAAKIHRDLQIKRRDEKWKQLNQMKKITEPEEQSKVEDISQKLKKIEIADAEQEIKSAAIENSSAIESSSAVENKPAGESVLPVQSLIGQSDVQLSETIKRIEERPRQDNHTVHGPYRLMRLLPHAARPLISRMLKYDPNERATMDDIFNDEWFDQIKACTEDENGNPINIPTHAHTLVSEDKAHLESYKENK